MVQDDSGGEFLWADRSHTQESQLQLSLSPSTIIILMPLLFVLMTQTPTSRELSECVRMGQQADAMACSETGCWQVTSINTTVIPARFCHCSIPGLAEEGG